MEAPIPMLPPASSWAREDREELANAITHGVGAALSIAALVVMVVFASLRGTARHIVGAAIFGSMLVILYLMSTLYHSFRGRRVKKVFRVLDHSAIFLLIAGTYTPLCLATLRGPWGWSLFGIVWGLAAVGITVRSLVISLSPAEGPSRTWERVSLTVYLLMGWVVVIALGPLWRAMPVGGLAWLGAGGAFYTLGSGLYAWHRLPYHHAFWHLAVVGGSACHVACVLGFVIP